MHITIPEKKTPKYNTGDIILQEDGNTIILNECYDLNGVHYYASSTCGMGIIGSLKTTNSTHCSSLKELIVLINSYSPILKHYSQENYELQLVEK